MMTSFFLLARRLSAIILILAVIVTAAYYIDTPAINVSEAFRKHAAFLQFIASGLLLQIGGFCLLLKKKRWAVVFCALGAYFAIRSGLTEGGWSGV